MSQRYLFVEESGGLLRDLGADLAELRLPTGLIPALTRFRQAGFRIVILVDPADLRTRASLPCRKSLEPFIDALLASQNIAAEARLYCRHEQPSACDCALPGIGLVAEYIADARLDRRRSLLVGDRAVSLELARAMGLAGFQLGEATSWTDVAHAVLDLPRRARIERKTRETDIVVEVDLDRGAEPVISTGIGFFDHMLEQLGKHGGFELKVQCHGDLAVDEHHTIEDVALAIGQALREALGDKRGIGRYGFLLPMDEAEAQVAIDLSGRAYAVFAADFPRENVGGMPTELVGHFFHSLAESLGAALHITVRGDNAHHMIEASFKGVARTLRQAFARSGTELPSTKGTL
jgi:imidazoleglycerol-phosphate dehydratase/histidinol-phosphatase